VLFLLLRAQFVAAVQVVVYAGAVMVLYVFVVAYVGGEGGSLVLRSMGDRATGSGPVASGLRVAGAVAGAALLVELLIALLGTGLEAIDHYGAPYPVGAPEAQTFGTPGYIGQLLLTRFLLVFEVASFLLLVAAVGGVVLARRRRGISEDEIGEDYSPLHLRRPPTSGTMREGVGRASAAARLASPGPDVPGGHA
jgi:NADH-quinone oxidoreductase subunit J